MFWDSSALLAVVGYEPRGPGLARLLKEDREAVIWCLTPVEIRSGLARGVRVGAMGGPERELSWQRFTELQRTFSEISAVFKVRDRAERLLDAHALRAGDALQLAAAIVGAKGRPETVRFVTLDRRLAEAASKERFPVLPPLTGEGSVAEGTPAGAARGPSRRRPAVARTRRFERARRRAPSTR